MLRGREILAVCETSQPSNPCNNHTGLGLILEKIKIPSWTGTNEKRNEERYQTDKKRKQDKKSKSNLPIFGGREIPRYFLFVPWV